MKVATEKRCGCRDEGGKKYPRGKCPKLSKRTHGAWAWRFRVPKELVPLVGKPELSGSGFATKKEAEEDAEKAVAKVRAGQQSIGGLTVAAWLTMWLAGKRRLKPTTRRVYEGHIRLHLVPLLGSIPLAALQPSHIDAAYRLMESGDAERSRAPIGPSTVARVHATLRAALNDAVDQRKIQWSPADAVELPEYAADEIEPWDAEEVGRFLDEAAGDPHAAMYELIALHGLRRGEACGAAWPGLDVARSVLTIDQQITDSGGVLGVWAPKTRSGKRKVDLDATTLGALLKHRLRQDAERELVGDGWSNGTLPDEHGRPVQLSGLMFTRPDGRYLDPGYVTKHMQVIARRVGLLAGVVADAPTGSKTVTVGRRHAEPEGVWTLYRDREPIGTVTVVACVRRRGAGATLTLAEPLPFDLHRGDELGRDLLSRRRLHDLQHSSASIQFRRRHRPGARVQAARAQLDSDHR